MLINIKGTYLDAKPVDQPRARGFVKLSAKYVEGRSRIDKLHQSGSLKVLFPRNQTSFLQAVTVNTAGGATGGDQFKIDATVKKNARLTLTTQAAERAYMAQEFTAASIQNKVTVEKNAQLHWMPQETILFENSNLSRSLVIDMHETSKCLLVEPLVFGRIASGERLNSVKIRDHIEIRKNGYIHFLEKLFLSNNITEHLRSATIANGANVMVLVVYIGSDAGKLLPVVRSMLPETAGASLVKKDTLVLRALAPNSYEMRHFLIPVLKRLSGNLLPKPWMI